MINDVEQPFVCCPFMYLFLRNVYLSPLPTLKIGLSEKTISLDGFNGRLNIIEKLSVNMEKQQ